MRSQKTSSDRPKKNASATAVRNARKCAGQSGQKSKVQKNKKQTRVRLLHVKSIKNVAAASSRRYHTKNS